jgi:hypothetical protein
MIEDSFLNPQHFFFAKIVNNKMKQEKMKEILQNYFNSSKSC